MDTTEIKDTMPLSSREAQDLSSGNYWTTRQLANLLSFSVIYIQILCEKGTIHALKYGSRWRIPRTEIKRVVRDGLKPPPREPVAVPVEELIVGSKEKQAIDPLIKKPFLQREIKLWEGKND